MPHYGTCPFWLGESRDLLETRCKIGRIRFPDMGLRRLVVFPYCSGNYEKCSIYKALEKAGIDNENT